MNGNSSRTKLNNAIGNAITEVMQALAFALQKENGASQRIAVEEIVFLADDEVVVYLFIEGGKGIRLKPNSGVFPRYSSPHSRDGVNVGLEVELEMNTFEVNNMMKLHFINRGELEWKKMFDLSCVSIRTAVAIKETEQDEGEKKEEEPPQKAVFQNEYNDDLPF